MFSEKTRRARFYKLMAKSTSETFQRTLKLFRQFCKFIYLNISCSTSVQSKKIESQTKMNSQKMSPTICSRRVSIKFSRCHCTEKLTDILLHISNPPKDLLIRKFLIDLRHFVFSLFGILLVRLIFFLFLKSFFVFFFSILIKYIRGYL